MEPTEHGIKLISDGTVENTKLVTLEGEPITNVTISNIEIKMGAETGYQPVTTVTFDFIPVEYSSLLEPFPFSRREVIEEGLLTVDPPEPVV
jgi:hypothetical protein